MRFTRHIGIDYSGAQTAESRLMAARDVRRETPPALLAVRWIRGAGRRSVVAEVYPSIFRRRYPKEDRTPDEHDAYCVAAWLAEVDRRGALDYYFKPPLSLPESRRSRLEGWILGVC